MVSGFNMKYSTNVIAFKSHIKSAMNDDISWDMVDLMLDNLCTTFEKSKQVIYVLLEELKLFKIANTSYSDEKHNLFLSYTPHNDNENEIKEELNDSSGKIKDPLVDARMDEDFCDEGPEDSYDKFTTEDYYNTKNLSEEQFDHSIENDANVRNFSCDRCEKTYTNDNALRKHKKRKHNWQYKDTLEPKEKVQCDQCDKKFSQGSLWKHKKDVHNGRGIKIRKPKVHGNDQIDTVDIKSVPGSIEKEESQESKVGLDNTEFVSDEDIKEPSETIFTNNTSDEKNPGYDKEPKKEEFPENVKTELDPEDHYVELPTQEYADIKDPSESISDKDDPDYVEEQLDCNESESYSCEKCFASFKHKKSLYRHQRVKHNFSVADIVSGFDIDSKNEQSESPKAYYP